MQQPTETILKHLRKFGKTERLYPPVKRGEYHYRSDFDQAARDEARELRHRSHMQNQDNPEEPQTIAWRFRAASSLENRLLGYRLCGLFTKYQKCKGCGAGDVASSSYLSGGNARPCHLRGCTFCGRRAGAEKTKNLLALWQDLPKREDYRLRHITVQIAWNPSQESDVTTEAFRDRARRGWEAIRGAYHPERYLGLAKEDPLVEHALLQEGTALYVKLEASATGFLHFHMLHYGPFLRFYCARPECKERCRCVRSGVKAKKVFYLQDLLRKSYPKIGELWITEVKEGTESSAVQEVCKYVSKGPSPLDEKAILGEPRWRMHPTIAARLELALFGVHCNEVYAGFRKKAAPRGSKEELDNFLGELSSGELGLLEDLFGKNYATYEDFLDFIESVTLGQVWEQTTEEEERGLVNALRELREAHGPYLGQMEQLVGELGELLATKAQAEEWLDPHRACAGCGLAGEWEAATMTTVEWIQYKRALHDRPREEGSDEQKRLHTVQQNQGVGY